MRHYLTKGGSVAFEKEAENVIFIKINKLVIVINAPLISGLYYVFFSWGKDYIMLFYF